MECRHGPNKTGETIVPFPSLIWIALLALLAFIVFRQYYLSRRVRHCLAGEVAEKLKIRAPITLLDVRTVRENRSGHLQGSINIPLHDLRQRIHELEAHRGREIIVYCATGNRSMRAAHFLQKNGFNAFNMRGGMIAWQALKNT
jgi:rhodanese-related sulfurtransferase